MTYEEWQARWALPDQAIAELREITTRTSTPGCEDTEDAVANECRLELANHGIVTMRNNVGVLNDVNGRPVRYGLCNESKGMNQVIKSPDDILIIPYVVKPSDVGRLIGRFGGAEYKKRSWVYTGKGREVQQMNFHRMANHAGGLSFFANGRKSVIDILVSHGLISR